MPDCQIDISAYTDACNTVRDGSFAVPGQARNDENNEGCCMVLAIPISARNDEKNEKRCCMLLAIPIYAEGGRQRGKAQSKKSQLHVIAMIVAHVMAM